MSAALVTELCSDGWHTTMCGSCGACAEEVCAACSRCTTDGCPSSCRCTPVSHSGATAAERDRRFQAAAELETNAPRFGRRRAARTAQKIRTGETR